MNEVEEIREQFRKIRMRIYIFSDLFLVLIILATPLLIRILEKNLQNVTS